MWQGQFQREQSYETKISGEMRAVFADWIAEHYGIHPGTVEFDNINHNHATFTLPLGECDSAGYGSSIKLYLQPTGKIDATLHIHGPGETKDTLMPLPSGELPPDKESFAVMVCDETVDCWKRRGLGWHPGYREMLKCLSDMAQTEGIDFDCMTVGGFYPDGEELPDFATSYDPTAKGLVKALTHARAMLKGGQEYLANTPLEYDTGDFLLVIFPGDCPLETGEWLTTAGPNYADWVADMPVTHPGSNDPDADENVRRWRNVTPLHE